VLPEEEIVRICSLVVATATGVDPLAHCASRKGNADLQYSRALWVHLIVCEMGVSRGRCSYLCDRSLESIDRYLAEIEELRSDEEFSERLDRWAESAKNLMALIFDFARITPSRRTRQVARAIVNERAVA
jgi:hypothetical protein